MDAHGDELFDRVGVDGLALQRRARRGGEVGLGLGQDVREAARQPRQLELEV